MASYYAKLDQDNIVVQVITLDNGLDINPETNEVDHNYAETYCSNLYGGKWVNTCIIDNMIEQTDEEHRRTARLGDRYDEELDAFVPPQPYPSWTLDNRFIWIPPIPMPIAKRTDLPDKSFYIWDEDAYQADNTQGWVVKNYAQVKLEQLGLTVDELKVILGL